MRLRLITAPTEEPVTLAEAVQHLRLTSDSENARVLALIFAARELAEAFTSRAFITQTWELVLEKFEDTIALPKPPLQSVVSLKYYDTAGVQQTLATSAYQVDDCDTGGRIVPAVNTCWPATVERIDAVIVRFKCGYGGAAKVPFAILAGMLLHVEAHFDRDERTMDRLLEAAQALWFPHRAWRF